MALHDLLSKIRELEKSAGLNPRSKGEMEKWPGWKAEEYLRRLEDLNLRHLREIRLMEKRLGITPTPVSKIEQADIFQVLNYLDKLEAEVNKQQILPPA